ncbi:MAG: ATP-binding protein, partial [Dysosmobacter sp.]|nr:ATP-binding protein [Dysosmobacter sp.]
MGIPVLILGESGSGKSTSLRNFELGEIGIFNVASKPLPFRKQLPCANGVGYDTILRTLAAHKLKSYAIDDAQFLMSDQYFDNIYTNDNFKLFKDIGCNFRNLIKFVSEKTPSDVIVYFLPL